jgi:hypothetical protein
MIDYLLCAPSPSAALADPSLSAYVTTDGGWNLSIVNPGLQVWADAGDTTISDPQTGQPLTMHAYLPGFWFSISPAARDAALEASPFLVLGANRDMADAGGAMAQFVFAFGPGQSLDRFVGMHVSPLMEGADYKFG